MNTPHTPLYGNLAPVYDFIYGLALQPGRRRAMHRLRPQMGESILEVGIGTGVSVARYPRGCRVTAIDLSEHMLGRAQARLDRHGRRHIRLCRMDATQLGFRDAEFDAVYAPYVLNVVADPIAAAREMVRVCRPGGRIVLLNHFDHAGTQTPVDRVAGRFASALTGVKWDLSLDRLLGESGLEMLTIEAVNVPRVSSVVVCRAQS